MSADSPRVVLVGLGTTTLAALEGLTGSFQVVALVRDGDDETTRRATELGVPIVADTTIAGVAATIDEHHPDAVVVSSFNRILGPGLLERCPFVNVHYAPLPRGRGRATVQWALVNGDDAAWITVHHLVAELDAGGILFQDSVPIGPTSTVTSLYDELNALQRAHLAAAVGAAMDGDPGRAQDEAYATYYCGRIPDDGEIDWSRSTAEIDRLVRALQPPFPHAFTWLGLERIAVVCAAPVAEPRQYDGRISGRVVNVDRAEGWVEILTGDGVLRVERVRGDVGDVGAAASVIRSVSATLGLRTADLVRALRGTTGTGTSA